MTGVREARKRETRQRVLQAARDLFVEQGFETTRVREIAERAGVAAGSVFTTFSSKHAILRAVMDERLEGLSIELESLAAHLRGSTLDKLCSVMAFHYEFEMRRPRLFTAFLAANFQWVDDDEPLITFGRQARLNRIIGDIVRQGIEAGEVRGDTDVDIFIETLLAAYAFNYRHAAQTGADARELSQLMELQIGLLFRGVAAE